MNADRSRLHPLAAAALVALLGGCTGAVHGARSGPQAGSNAPSARPSAPAAVAPRVSSAQEAAPESTAEWESLSALPDGNLQYERAVGWFDHQACKGYALQRSRTIARGLADGIAYAFRTSCPRCKGHGEKLHILAPRSEGDSDVNGEEIVRQGWGMSYSHTELPLHPGGGGSMIIRFAPSGIEEWKKSGVKPARSRHGMLGVEVTQGVGEAEPVAVVYVADRPPP